MFTNMRPLRMIARGLQNETYFAQYVAKTSFMGTYIVQTMTATPPDDQIKSDRIFDLYLNSNQPTAREQLERLSDEYSNGLVSAEP